MLRRVLIHDHQQHRVRALAGIAFLAANERAIDAVAHALGKSQRPVGG